LPVDEYHAEDAIAVGADASNLVFFGFTTVHGSAPNRTPNDTVWRRSVAAIPTTSRWQGRRRAVCA
jgi:ectoine hydroxylase-related dioxygenase (phytanoyl-CoA dioxygenase family)